MKVRLGYVAIALGLPKVTSSSTVTYANYQKLVTEEKRLNKLKQVTYSNFDDLKKILKYNVKHQIHFYRLTSALIPLATHPDVDWDYRGIFEIELKLIGEMIRKHHLRVGTHPDQFNVINSVDPQVVENTKRNLLFQTSLFEDMNLTNAKMVLHIGSSAGGKADALERFRTNFQSFPKEITSRLILENDDKTFTAKETLRLCQSLGVPMVLDVHHHICNNNGDELKDMLPSIFETWKDQSLPPKLHFSSPKDHPTDRKHTDMIDGKHFVEFIEDCKLVDLDLDIMLEAKQKDLALFNLVKQIKELRKEWKWIDQSTFEL